MTAIKYCGINTPDSCSPYANRFVCNYSLFLMLIKMHLNFPFAFDEVT